MKRVMLLIMAVAVAGALACPAAGETITIVGTGSGASILQAIGTAFTQIHPDLSVEVPKSIGSGGGIKAVGLEEALLGRVARGIKDKEKPYGLSYLPFAKMPIAFFVNKSVPVQELSPQQVCDIYCGKITNWNAVGGPDAKIRVVRREDGDSSLKVLLESFPGFKDIAITSKSKTTYSDPATTELVANKADTIAFGTYPNAKRANVTILSIAGQAPAEAAYPYVGTLALVFKAKNRTGNVGQFVDFTTTPAAHSAIVAVGGLPL